MKKVKTNRLVLSKKSISHLQMTAIQGGKNITWVCTVSVSSLLACPAETAPQDCGA